MRCIISLIGSPMLKLWRQNRPGSDKSLLLSDSDPFRSINIGGRRQGGGERFLCLACETLVCGDWGKKNLADHAEGYLETETINFSANPQILRCIIEIEF